MRRSLLTVALMVTLTLAQTVDAILEAETPGDLNQAVDNWAYPRAEKMPTVNRWMNQMTLVDRPTAMPTRGVADGDTQGSRYSPDNGPVAGSGGSFYFPDFTEDTDGRDWLILKADTGAQAGYSKSRYLYFGPNSEDSNYVDDSRDSFAMECEFKFVDQSNSNNMIWLMFEGSSFDTTSSNYSFRQRASSTDIRGQWGGGAYSNEAFSSQLSQATHYSMRVVCTMDTGGLGSGTIQVYIVPGSITDRRIIGGADLTWTKVLDLSTFDMAKLETINFQFNPVNAGITTGTNPANWFRCLWTGRAEDIPTAATDGTTSWFDMHENVMEGMSLYWSEGDGKYVLTAAANVHHGVTPGDSSMEADLVIYPSLTDYTNDTNRVATITSGSISEVRGYTRNTLSSGAIIEPDTGYVVAWEVTATDSAYNGTTKYSYRSKPCFFTAPPARGEPYAVAPWIEAAGCMNSFKQGHYSDLGAHRSRAIDGQSDGSRVRMVLELGDANYMDEKKLLAKDGDWDGNNNGVPDGTLDAEGAETRQQMDDCMSLQYHRFIALEEARYWLKYRTGDDHERAVNDACIVDMLYEDRLMDGATQIVPWRKRGKGATNIRYGFPNAVKWFADLGEDEPEYGLPPRTVAENLLANWQSWGLNLAAPVSAGLRFDASDFNKYGATPFDQHDMGYWHTALGNLHLLVLDTRGSMTMSTDFNQGTYTGTYTPTFFHFAKTWVENTIAAIEEPGVIIMIPGYIAGYGPDGTMKTNDNIGYYVGTGANSDEPIPAEAIAVFKTALDANPNIKWAVVCVSDNHFASMIGGPGDPRYSSKILAQLADGAAGAHTQDPLGLGNVSGISYRYLTDFGIRDRGGFRGRTQYEITDTRTGRGTVRLWDENAPAPGSPSLEAAEALSGCRADLNGDGEVDTLDFLAFLNLWTAGDPAADWNGDGTINTLDILAYQNDWTAGC